MTGFRWVMVTDQAGLGDEGFNDLAFAGISQAATQLGGSGDVIESSEQAQYVPNLQQSVDAGANLTVGVGFLITDAIEEVAEANPDSNFVLIDAVADSARGFDPGEPLPNVQSVLYAEHEAAYLAGIIAGMTTQADKLAYVGGIEIPPTVRFLSGFQQGVASVNSAAEVDRVVGGRLRRSHHRPGADLSGLRRRCRHRLRGGRTLRPRRLRGGQGPRCRPLGARHRHLQGPACARQLPHLGHQGCGRGRCSGPRSRWPTAPSPVA